MGKGLTTCFGALFLPTIVFGGLGFIRAGLPSGTRGRSLVFELDLDWAGQGAIDVSMRVSGLQLSALSQTNLA
jgi:hypothetical protein